jgi:acetolactate synthase-1/2/3 large subunit
MAVQNADLILAIGARFDDRVTGLLDHFAVKADIIHIDVDTTSIHKILDVDVPLVADARQALAAILDGLGLEPDFPKESRRQWQETIRSWHESCPLTYERDPSGLLKPQTVIETLYQKTGGRAVIVTDVGQHQMWAAQYYLYDSPRQFITSGGLGVMGFGLPAALGVLVARPGSTVINITGDGSILMNIQELATVAQERLPVKVAILNNGTLGMVRQWQDLFYSQRYADTLLTSPDFVKLAGAFGIEGFTAETETQAGEIIDQALARSGPVLMDFKVCAGENVFPMVPAGRAIDEMILRPLELP